MTGAERAQSIVNLLLSQSGDLGALASVIKPRSITSTLPPPAPEPKTRKSKVNPEIQAFIESSLGVPVVRLVDQIFEQFGVRVGQGSIYKVWQRRYKVES